MRHDLNIQVLIISLGSMEFSKGSWHYKNVLRFFGHSYFTNYEFGPQFPMGTRRVERNISLCKYFWSVVLSTICLTIYYPFGLIIDPLRKWYEKSQRTKVHKPKKPKKERLTYQQKEVLGTVFLISFIGFLMVIFVIGLFIDWQKTLYLTAYLALIIGGGIGGGRLARYIHEHKTKKSFEKMKKDKPPSLIKEYTRSRFKNKVCPILKFKDDEVFSGDPDELLR